MGDYIATLDRSSFYNTLKDEQEQLDSDMTQLKMKVLDTAVVLSSLRDDIRNQYFLAEEAQIKLDQSKFEPPATQRQSEIDLDKAQRTLAQKQKIYSLKKAQTNAEIRTLKLKVSTQQRKVNDLDSVLKSFVIKAPTDGMVIYKKDRMGQKITVGTTLNPWEPAVATLPDLSSLLSKIYVSEIDISRIQKGQTVDITIDAFPDRHFQGKVFSIANIGEQLSNSDTKVFEVLVKIDNSDPMLRPSMTTSNKVMIETFDNVIYVPNESVHAGIDSIPFVYTRNGLKQVVLLGKSNDKNIIIEEGLEPGTDVWLTVPENAEKFRIAGTELIPKIKEREVAKLEKSDKFGLKPLSYQNP
jgi:RND family efflux transporter MFP subunit